MNVTTCKRPAMLLAAALLSAALAGGASGFDFQSVDSVPFRERAVTQVEDDIRVTAAVPDKKETRELFGLSLYRKRIQPVWIEIENGSDQAVGFMPILHASLLAAFAVVLAGVLTPGEARNAVDLDVILVIAGAFGLAAALEVSGLAQLGAGALVTAFGEWGAVGGLAGVALATIILHAIVTNNATAVLMFPIAISTATQFGADPRPFAVGDRSYGGE